MSLKIVGIGTDIVQIARIKRLWASFGEKFADKILHPLEMKHFKETAHKENFLAKRFAAKEATAKALGLGFREGLAMTQIVIGHDPWGKPTLSFSGAAFHLAEKLRVIEKHLTISDERHYAVAFVILSGKEF